MVKRTLKNCAFWPTVITLKSQFKLKVEKGRGRGHNFG